MKIALCFLLIFLNIKVSAQQLQLHYDARHSLDPKHNPKNFTSLFFEYLKQPDTGRLIKPGTFLLKIQADLVGDKANIGKYYMQVSQEVRFWRPKIFINLQYSGGLGITTPREYSYYIVNAYSIGISYPFKLGDAYLSSVLNYRFTSYIKPSQDLFYTLYFYKGLYNYRAEFAGDFSVWTENKDHGDNVTISEKGKRFGFFAEPQFWYKLHSRLWAGTKLNVFYHVNTTEDLWQMYPTLAFKIKL